MESHPPTLLNLLSVSLVLRQIAPHLPISSLLALSSISKAFRSLLFDSQEAFCRIDLSNVKSAQSRYTPIDTGGISWRSERMDESLTEHEFHSGPLRGIISKLARRKLLYNIQTLILDGLSVTAEIVREIIAEDQYNVRLLSIRQVKNMSERQLMHVLRYAVRPTRPEGTPKLKGLYFFGPKDTLPDRQVSKIPRPQRPPPDVPSKGVMSSEGAQIGAEWNQKSQSALASALTMTEEAWYQPTGKMLKYQPSTEWAETIKLCEGIITFDVTLCRGPRHDPSTAQPAGTAETLLPGSKAFLKPAIATFALGPSGCSACGSCPEGAAIHGQSPSHYFPLLAPPPLHSSTVRAAQYPTMTDHSPPPPLILRCGDCLRGRWCERCNRWWDENCYSGPITSRRTALQQQETTEDLLTVAAGNESRDNIKVGVTRECFGCGWTCVNCTSQYIRRCQTCGNDYCLVDNEGSSYAECDWCSHSGRRTRELY